MRIVSWGYQQQRLRDAGRQDFLERTKVKWIGWDKMVDMKDRVILLMRSNRKVDDLESRFGDSIREMQWIWSLWDGYWADDQYARPLCEKHGIKRIQLHTSGHAAWGDIQRMIESINAPLVIPVHTQSPTHFTQRIRNVYLPADGETIAL